MGFFELDADDVVEAIKEWLPGPVFTEQRCREALFNFLRDRFPKKGLTKEEPITHGRADIMVKLKDWTGLGATVAIELKYALTATNEYKRLIGQIAEYIKEGLEVIVVLCGKSKDEFVSGVKEHMQTLSSGKFAFKGHVIQKSVGERAGKGQFLPGNARSPKKK